MKHTHNLLVWKTSSSIIPNHEIIEVHRLMPTYSEEKESFETHSDETAPNGL